IIFDKRVTACLAFLKQARQFAAVGSQVPQCSLPLLRRYMGRASQGKVHADTPRFDSLGTGTEGFRRTTNRRPVFARVLPPICAASRALGSASYPFPIAIEPAGRSPCAQPPRPASVPGFPVQL